MLMVVILGTHGLDVTKMGFFLISVVFCLGVTKDGVFLTSVDLRPVSEIFRLGLFVCFVCFYMNFLSLFFFFSR